MLLLYSALRTAIRKASAQKQTGGFAMKRLRLNTGLVLITFEEDYAPSENSETASNILTSNLFLHVY